MKKIISAINKWAVKKLTSRGFVNLSSKIEDRNASTNWCLFIFGDFVEKPMPMIDSIIDKITKKIIK